MNIQIFGTKKCNDTKKAERFFKERRIKFQFIDLKEKALSKGELQSVKKALSLESLINKNSKDYKKLNLDKIRGAETREEILLKNPSLYVTPIVRNGKEATVGYDIETWKKWEWLKLRIKNEKLRMKSLIGVSSLIFKLICCY